MEGSRTTVLLGEDDEALPRAESFDNQVITRCRELHHERLADPLKPTDLALLIVNRQGNVMYIPIQGEKRDGCLAGRQRLRDLNPPQTQGL
ncbi:MAG: hypothetical protein P0120_19415 [Nitrospira sp.]|nr:hypothetical protein [Nitrospira sp.]